MGDGNWVRGQDETRRDRCDLSYVTCRIDGREDCDKVGDSGVIDVTSTAVRYGADARE